MVCVRRVLLLHRPLRDRGWGMILVFALLILFVSMLVAIPLALDSELRQNVTFWGIPVMVVVAFLLWA